MTAIATEPVWEIVLANAIRKAIAEMLEQKPTLVRRMPLVWRRRYQRLRHFLFGIHSWRSRRHKEFGYSYSYYVCRICNKDYPNHGK